MKRILHFFDRLEDKVRARLSHYPIIYSLVAGFAIVIFWWSVWQLADQISLSPFWLLVGSVLVLLITGVFTSFFVGDTILISGLKKEKKLIEKTEDELNLESSALKRLQGDVSREEIFLSEIRSELKELKTMMERFKNSDNK
ncbi:MAG: hypothetical protein Q7S34_04065 [bacterium]|nr:hypothetical protein [bacterium]